MLPNKNIGQYAENPDTATRLYFGCQSHDVNAPFMSKFKWSRFTLEPVKTSQRYGFPFSEGHNKYLLSGDTEQFTICF